MMLLTASLTFFSCVRLDSPELITPLGGEVLLTATPEFIWHGVPYARFYSTQLSRNADFSESLDTLIFDDTTFVMADTLLLGQTYYWRVSAHNAQGTESDPSGVESFKVKEGVDLNTPPASDSTARPSFSWSSFPQASSYSFELSLYADFRETYFDSSFSTTSLDWSDSLPPATYYWRVRAFDSGEPISSWSVVRRLVTYRLIDTYFPLYLGREQTFEWTHIVADSNTTTEVVDTVDIDVYEVTFRVKDTFWEKNRLYWVISDTLWDVGDTFSITHDSIFSLVYYMGALFPSDDEASGFESWRRLPFEIINDSSGLIHTWKNHGTRGASGYDSIGILRLPGQGVVRMVHFTSDVPIESFNWTLDSLELK